MTNTKQFVVAAGFKREERDAGSSVTRRLYERGQTISGTSNFYSKPYLDSISEMTDGSGVAQAQYSYDPYGRVIKLQGSLDSDFQYAGYYIHQRSALNLTVFRAYSAQLGRWLSRDPIEENGGVNLYAYVDNMPNLFTDPSGLFLISGLPLVCPKECPPGDTSRYCYCKNHCNLFNAGSPTVCMAVCMMISPDQKPGDPMPQPLKNEIVEANTNDALQLVREYNNLIKPPGGGSGF